MAKIVQAVTLKRAEGVTPEDALEELKRAKKFLDGKGVTTRLYWAIEAGTESGHATIVQEFPNAAAWAALVDSDDPELQAMRRRGVESHAVISTSILQEIDIS